MSDSNQHLSPIYINKQINQPITLYEGNMIFSACEDLAVRSYGFGIVSFNWFPTLKIKYQFNAKDSIHPDVIQHGLELSDIGIVAKGQVHSLSLSSSVSEQKAGITGSIHEPVVVKSNQKLSYLIFHIINFHDYIGLPIQNNSSQWAGRLVLEAHGWRVTIDSLEPGLRKELLEALKNDGGYAITHVAKLERIDYQTFSDEEASDVLSGLSYFLAFTRGMWVGPMLPVGFDSSGNRLWESWIFYKATSYQEVISWFPLHKPQNLIQLFVGFMKRWTDSIWQEPIKLAIHWYVESNLQAGAIEGSIIMAQAAFELLFEVLRSPTTNVDGNKKLSWLFKWANLPNNFSNLSFDLNLLNELEAFSMKKKIEISKALTEVRSRITHPKPNKNSMSIIHSTTLIKATWLLSLYYLELVILHLFEYQGLHKSRIKYNWEGDYDELPWLTVRGDKNSHD